MRNSMALVLVFAIGVCACEASAAAKIRSTHATASVIVLNPLFTGLTAGFAFGRVHTDARRFVGGTVTISSAPPVIVSTIGVKLVAGETAPSPAIYHIRGDALSAYVVNLPSADPLESPDGCKISNFTLWSANSGTITTSGVGHLNAAGNDTLRVGATITVPKSGASTSYDPVVSITISYQ
jgi:hypothetical protein